ncbi:MAG: hypothetical protein A3G34_06325 [Candidatus Lindowbacteria bacterium RIFCSPLOWO2_12_FULL_62_27]|nr:MAG: hypothetical protein A3G34_06325 [Candidatus Lindowbacteria bacterium RIFCSPLOWO2_12_FULL_62_27]OGH58779.1 MAG: hypothetical protein A3I06_09720 [Candidatus Lindowbacteria bacterium RIFCSPLOWO2_02_FULL_62_12]
MKSERFAILLLRLYVGYLFLMAGWSKWTQTPPYTTGEDIAHFLNVKLAACEPNTIGSALIQGYYLPHSKLLAWMVVLGEMAVGAALLSGTATRLACVCGIFMNANFFIATSGSFLTFDNNAFFILIQLLLLCAAAGRFMGIDYFLSKKFSNAYLW